MAWNIAHLAKGSFVSPTSRQGGGCFLFFLPERAGRNLVPDQSREVQSDTSEGREKHLFLGRTHSYYC